MGLNLSIYDGFTSCFDPRLCYKKTSCHNELPTSGNIKSGRGYVVKSKDFKESCKSNNILFIFLLTIIPNSGRGKGSYRT